jgi:hypothetical protein
MTLATLLSLYPATVNKTFTYVADKDLNSVSVAGTFNDWNKLTNPMTRSGHVWSATVKLPLGKTLYKFVINNENWITDPKNVDSESDGNGNTNSRLLATPDGYEIPAKIGDGQITTSGISHETVAPGWSYERGRLTVRMQTRSNDVASVIAQAGS